MISESETILRSSGIRVTKPRVIIYDYILSTKSHPTCEEIYEALKKDNPSLSFATVYNVTEKLYDEKMLLRLNSPSGERRYDAVTAFHGHFYCDSCGKVIDLECKAKDLFSAIKGFDIRNVDITATGTCSNCN